MGATVDPTGSRTVRSIVAFLAAPSGVGAGRDPTAAGDPGTGGVGVIVEGEDDFRDALGTAGLGGVLAAAVDADGVEVVVERAARPRGSPTAAAPTPLFSSFGSRQQRR